MFDDFDLTAVPPGRLLAACPRHRILKLDSGRAFVAVEMTANRLYTATLADPPPPHGAARYTSGLAVYGAQGEFMAGATSAAPGPDTLCTFTPVRNGIHYIEARGCSFSLGAPDPSVRDSDALPFPDPSELDDARTRATDLGEITSIDASLLPVAHSHGRGERLALVRFSLARPAREGLELRVQGSRAELMLESSGQAALCGRTRAGAPGEWLIARLEPGTYCARIRQPWRGAQPFVLRYTVCDAARDTVPELLAHSAPRSGRIVGDSGANGSDAPATPDGGTANRVSLGTVVEPDAAGRGVRHLLVGGNDAGLFELDPVTGELFFTGREQDMPHGTTEIVLTVRSHDGERFEEVSVPISAERDDTPPTLVHTRHGSRISLGRVGAPIPPGGGFRYRLAGGNEDERFELDEKTGELFFRGGAQEFEALENVFELTVHVEPRRH